jgi:hypothetical protein
MIDCCKYDVIETRQKFRKLVELAELSQLHHQMFVYILAHYT